MSEPYNNFMTFYSENANAVRELYNDFDEVIQASKDTADDYMIENFIKKYYPSVDVNNFDVWGWLWWDGTEIETGNGYTYFQAQAESSSRDEVGLFYLILKDFYPDIKLAYSSDCLGGADHVKWDETNYFYPENFFVDGELSDPDNPERLESVYELYDGGYCKAEDIEELYDELLERFPYLEDAFPVGYVPDDCDDIYYGVNAFVDSSDEYKGELFCMEFGEESPEDFYRNILKGA